MSSWILFLLVTISTTYQLQDIDQIMRSLAKRQPGIIINKINHRENIRQRIFKSCQKKIRIETSHCINMTFIAKLDKKAGKILMKSNIGWSIRLRRWRMYKKMPWKWEVVLNLNQNNWLTVRQNQLITKMGSANSGSQMTKCQGSNAY